MSIPCLLETWDEIFFLLSQNHAQFLSCHQVTLVADEKRFNIVQKYSTLSVTGQEVLGRLWTFCTRSHWVENPINRHTYIILDAYCVTVLPQGTIRNESNGRVPNLGSHHPLVIYLH